MAATSVSSARARPRRPLGPIVGQLALYLVLIGLAIVMVIPIAYMVSQSFTPEQDTAVWPIKYIPDHPTLINFVRVFNDPTLPVFRWFLNSMFASLSITALVLLLSAANIIPTAEAMLAGAAALVLAKCINMEEAYRAIEWRVVVLIAGMLPIGTALVETGLAARIGQAFTLALAPAGPLGLIAGLYLFTVILAQLVGGQVAALIVGPIAVSAAVQLGVNPPAVGVAVAIACSAAFQTPIAHPVKVHMMAPGGYTFNDFLRVGLGMTLICFVILLAVMPLFWVL
jgi:di/tricarboxylate transporter